MPATTRIHTHELSLFLDDDPVPPPFHDGQREQVDSQAPHLLQIYQPHLEHLELTLLLISEWHLQQTFC